jgi:nicotinamide mononucleotide adenylyltransferase
MERSANMLTAKAQNFGIQTLETNVIKTEEILQRASEVSSYELGAAQRLIHYYHEASKWNARVAGIFHFIDAIVVDEAAFYPDEWDRIIALRQRSEACLQRLNILYKLVSALASQPL